MVADLSHLHSECVHTVVQMPSIVQVKGLAFPWWCSWASSNSWPSLLAGVWLVLGGWSSLRWLVILWDVSPGSCEPLEKLQHPLPALGQWGYVTLFVIQPALVLWMDGLHHSDINLGWSAAALCNSSGHKGIKCCCVVGKMSFIWGSLCSVCCHSASAVTTSLPSLSRCQAGRPHTSGQRAFFHVHSWRVFLQQEVCDCAAIDRAAWFSMSNLVM